jgi:hypothetical protein
MCFFNLISVHNVFLAPIQISCMWVVFFSNVRLPIFSQPSVWVILAFLPDIRFSFPLREERFKIRTTGRDSNCSLHSSRGYFQVNKFRHTRVFANYPRHGRLSGSRQVWNSRHYSVNLDYALNCWPLGGNRHWLSKEQKLKIIQICGRRNKWRFVYV